jgi:hypothetical protein
MIHALVASLLTALLLRFLNRASRPAMLLSFLGDQWQAWLINRPTWLNAKVSGGCTLCTSWWAPGVPVALLVGCCTPAGWWAVLVPFLVSAATDFLLSK